MSGPARATLSLLRRCENACVTCAMDGLDRTGPRTADEVHAALRELRTRASEVSFVGGEPLLDPALEAHVAEARALGFRGVGVQTNGRRLAANGLVARLANAGLTDVQVSIHGAEAAVHDYHTGVDGSFAQTIAGVAAARARGLVVVAATVLTRSNFRVLAPMPALLGSRGVAGWLVSVPRVEGRALASFDRVVPRLGLALPFALHAIASARAKGLPSWISGAPRCLLGPLAAHALEVDGARAYGEPCAGCASRPSCVGLDATYLARFGGDELAQRAAAADVVDRPELRALFVGVGERAPLPDAPSVAEPPSRARVALPMLGKVQPARAEVPRSAEKKTGEALREILPSLFGDASPREGRG